MTSADVQRYQAAAAKLAAKGVASLDAVTAAEGVVEAIGLAVVDTFQRPDAVGTIELVIDGNSSQQLVLPKVPNNNFPNWSVGVAAGAAYKLTWTKVPLEKDSRLRLHLEDADPVGGNDSIGTVEINSEHLLEAARAKRVVPIYVGDQPKQQLLFVYVSVTLTDAQ